MLTTTSSADKDALDDMRPDFSVLKVYSPFVAKQMGSTP